MADDHLKRAKHSQRELELSIVATTNALQDKLSALAHEISRELKGTLGHVATSVDKVTDNLQTNLDQLSSSVGDFKQSLNVKTRVREEPLKMVGLAVALGAVAGVLTGHRKHHLAVPAKHESHSRVADIQRTTGPAALLGLAFSLLRPILITTAKDIVARNVGHRLSGGRSSTISTGGSDLGSEHPEGSVYHSY